MRLTLSGAISLLAMLAVAVAAAPRPPDPSGTTGSLEQAFPLPGGDDTEEERTLRDVLARRPRGKQEALVLLRSWVAAPVLTSMQECQFQILLQVLHAEEEVEELIAERVSSPKTPRAERLRLLRVLARSRVEPPAAWLRAIGRTLEDDDLAVRHEAVATVRARDLTHFDAALRGLSQDSSLPAELRVAALEVLAPRQRLSADAFALLTKQLAAAANPLRRRSAARVLGAARLDRNQLLTLAAELPNLTPTPAVLLLPAFARGRDAGVGRALVDGLQEAPATHLLSVGDLDRIFSQYPTVVVDAARPLRDKLLARARPRREHLSRVAAELPPGDARRGKEVFFSAKAGCAGCHRAAGKGGTVGPNLSRIGVIRGPADLLESIVTPSAYVTPEFRAYVVTTTLGGLATGSLVQETSDAVYLRGGKAAPQRVARDQVEDVVLSPTSLMPEGFERLLSRQELSDVVEFLAQLR